MFTTRPEILGTFGVVSSTHWLASAVGMSVLEKGGNAFDAAVATGFTLQIVEPHLNGPGGEVPIIFQAAGKDEPEVLCGQGVAPAAATVERFRLLGLNLVPGTGLLPAVVPGAFDAWMRLLQDYGTMRLRDVLEPGIGYARDGHPVLPQAAEVIASVASLFREEWQTSAAIHLSRGEAPAPRTRVRNRVLARTYQRIVDEAESATNDRDAQIEHARSQFYRGFVAETIDSFCSGREYMDSSGRRHAGLLRYDDLAGWTATYEPTLRYDYGGLTVHKTGPWGQGPVFLQQLALLKGFDLGAMDPNGSDFVHTVIECAKLAFADREAFYGDPSFVDVPTEMLLSADYNERRRALVGPEASFDLRPGAIEGAERRLPAWIGSTSHLTAGAGEPTFTSRPSRDGDTCHLDVADRHGNLVSATPSGGWLQSSPAIPELGFCLTTRGQMFWLEKGLAASLEPGKRPRTTLTPSLATRDGAPYLAFGTPGGDQQDQWTLIFLLRHLHHQMNLQEAIDAPLFHSLHFPSSFYPRAGSPGEMVVEERFSSETIADLRRRGHALTVAEDWSVGRVCAVANGPDFIRAAATPRLMQAYAIGR